jgi:hypothetical protein
MKAARHAAVQHARQDGGALRAIADISSPAKQRRGKLHDEASAKAGPAGTAGGAGRSGRLDGAVRPGARAVLAARGGASCAPCTKGP